MPIQTAPLISNPNGKKQKEFNTDVYEFNRLVNSNPQDIAAIYRQYQFIGNKYPKFVFEKTKFGKNMSYIDFEIRAEAKKKGVVLKAQDVSTAPGFVEILENMPPDVSQKLCQQISSLNAYSKVLITALQNPYTKGTAGFNQYEVFMQNNACRILGTGNSKVIEITPLNGGPSYIIKLNNNMGVPKMAAEHLGAKITGARVKTHTSIPTILNSGDSYDLMVMDSAGTDLAIFFADKKLDTYNKRSKAALPIFKQMADLLIQMQDNNIFFPDSKSSNWQLKEGKLMLADTKSIRFIKNPNTDFYPLDVTRTKYASPPEFVNPSDLLTTPEQIEKAHVFIMAINMVEALTGQQIKCDPINKDFGNISAVLKKIQDKDIKEILGKCLSPNPDMRPNLSQVKVQLEKVPLRDQLNKLSYSTDINDLKLQTFISSELNSLKSKTPEQCKELELKLNQFETNSQIKKVMDLISQLEQKKGGLINSSGAQKAEKVREAYYNMSIDDRLSYDKSKWEPVLDALAVRRGLGIFKPDSFKAFKQTLKEAKAKAKDKEPKVEQDEAVKPLHNINNTRKI